MDPKLLFWTGALANLGVIVACGALGVRAIRRRDVRAHRTLMGACAGLVALFLVAYLAKVAALGHEDRSAWTPLDHAVLYVHETCVAAMLVGGGLALFQAWRFRGRIGALRPPPEAPLPGRALHRRAGWAAAVGGLLAFLTAIGVWAGMWLRAG